MDELTDDDAVFVFFSLLPLHGGPPSWEGA